MPFVINSSFFVFVLYANGFLLHVEVTPYQSVGDVLPPRNRFVTVPQIHSGVSNYPPPKMKIHIPNQPYLFFLTSPLAFLVSLLPPLTPLLPLTPFTSPLLSFFFSLTSHPFPNHPHSCIHVKGAKIIAPEIQSSVANNLQALITFVPPGQKNFTTSVL